jgi:hypothetical protein
MMSLENLISELLLRHNCVVIPSFGGFVAGQIPAVFDTDKGVMMPPRKSLLFNKQLINNDGLLATSYAHHNHLNFEVANFFIKETVQKWQKRLARGERVSIENVGFLYLDAEKNIGFEQDRYSNLLLASYGLSTVHFIPETDIQFIVNEKTGRASIDEPKEITPIQPIEKVEEYIIEEKVESDTEELAPIIELHPKKKAWRYIAAAVLLPIAFYSYWIPTKTDVLKSGMISFSDFNPTHSQKLGEYSFKSVDFSIPKMEVTESIDKLIQSFPEDVDVFAYYYQDDIILPVRLHPEVNEDPIEEKESVSETPKKEVQSKLTTPVKTATPVSTGKHLIVGCFSTEKNANKLVQQLQSKGFKAYIVDVVNGLHRVSAINSSSDSALQNAKIRLDSMQISSWILKK